MLIVLPPDFQNRKRIWIKTNRSYVKKDYKINFQGNFKNDESVRTGVNYIDIALNCKPVNKSIYLVVFGFKPLHVGGVVDHCSCAQQVLCMIFSFKLNVVSISLFNFFKRKSLFFHFVFRCN